MTAIQIIHEIEALPFEEQRAVFSSLRERLKETSPTAGKIVYADVDEAMGIADRIFTERADLFKKLAE